MDSAGTERTDPEVWQQLAEVMTPSIVKVVEFSKRVPGFINVRIFHRMLFVLSVYALTRWKLALTLNSS